MEEIIVKQLQERISVLKNRLIELNTIINWGGEFDIYFAFSAINTEIEYVDKLIDKLTKAY